MNITFPPDKKTIPPDRFEISILNPLTYVFVDQYVKKKYGGFNTTKAKIYLTANLWYGNVYMDKKGVPKKHGARNEWLRRGEAKKKAILSIHGACIKVPNYSGYPIKLTVEYTYNRSGFDIDNKGYFWGKIFLDHIKSLGRITDDGVGHVNEVTYRFIKGEPNLKFIIEKI